LKLRRGTTTAHSTFTGAEGEVTVDTTKDTIVVHDGSTAGGFPLAKESGSNISAGTFSATSISDSGNLTFTGTGNRITGDFSNATAANRVSFQSSTTNGATIVNLLPNGTGTAAQLIAYSSADPTNSSFGQFRIGTDFNELRISSGILGTGTYLPMTFHTGGSERMRIDTSGNVGIGTSSPSAKLDVAVAGANLVQQLSGTSGVFTRLGTASSSFYQVHNGTTDTFLYTQEASALRFGTNAAERMRIDSSGNVGIGTSSPNFRLQLNTATASAAQYLQITNGSTGSAAGDGMLVGVDASNEAICWMQENAALKFATNNTERMRINSSGDVLMGTTSGLVAGAKAFFSSGYSWIYRNSSTSTDGTLDIYSNWGATARNVLRIQTDGNVLNFNNSYGSLSDATLKENIVDASPKLDDLLNVKIRNFNMIGDDNKQIGVIAQELEEVFPSMVSEGEDGIKSVKYSVFVPMLIKAIQELNAKVTALEAQLNKE
jgi:hypothetical protein